MSSPIETVGNAGLGVIASLLAYVAAKPKAWCFYGRETALVVACYLFALLALRVARVNLGWLSAEELGFANAWLLSVTAAGLMGTLALHLRRHGRSKNT